MTYYSRVTSDGEVTMPAQLAREIGLAPGERIRFDHDGQTILIRTTADVVRETQEAFRAMIKRPFTVDEFIAGRRVDAART